MCLTLAYSHRSGVKKMGRGIGRNTTPADKEAIAAAKLIIQALARKLFGTKLDQPDAYGHGGNSDTGIEQLISSVITKYILIKLFR